MAEKYSLKDELYNPSKVHKIASEIKAVYPDFLQDAFEKDIVEVFPNLELKERMYHIRDMLYTYLSQDYTKAVQILLKALPEPLDPTRSDDDFGDFIYAPYSEFVCAYGCNDTHVDFSLEALREMTKRFSVEYAIRDFINHYPVETLEMLEACALSDNYHERRLVSEGLRPKLPWAKKLTIDHTLPIRLLDILYRDTTRYVTRSVANHLNDISKINAPLVIETLKRWQKSGKQESKEMDFMVNHALRTLVKSGDEAALSLLGFDKNVNIKVGHFTLENEKVIIGDSLNLSLEIEAKEESKLMVDYIIHFRTKSGSSNPKVYKFKKLNLQKNQNIHLKKKHPFKANMTTRTLYEGEHKIELQINGKIYKSTIFTLSKKPSER